MGEDVGEQAGVNDKMRLHKEKEAELTKKILSPLYLSELGKHLVNVLEGNFTFLEQTTSDDFDVEEVDEAGTKIYESLLVSEKLIDILNLLDAKREIQKLSGERK